MIPGEVITPEGTIELSPGRARVTLTVEDDAARAVRRLGVLCTQARS